jgi:diphosphomevalonate decarboxylase
MHTASAQASPNIAFIKYWGNRDEALRLPANGSISMNLGELYTSTRVTFDPNLQADTLTINNNPAERAARARASALLDRVRSLAGIQTFTQVDSKNNFPTGAGIASSASAFAALALAASAAAGLSLPEKDLSRLARTGSGSACRSIPAGFTEWLPGTSDDDSYAVSLAPPDHWDLVDNVAIISRVHKPTGSTQGHALADTSPLQAARVADGPRRLDLCRRALLTRDFEALAAVTELDSNLMHAVMQTSTPPLLYWEPATVAIFQVVPAWRKSGTPVFYTIDAGPNVHVLCPKAHQARVAELLNEIPGVLEVLTAHPGGPARLI